MFALCAHAECVAQESPGTEEEVLEGVDRSERIRRGGVEAMPAAMPSEGTAQTEWAIPALAVPDYRPRASELIREGAVVFRRQGRLLGATGGGRVFVFDKGEQGETPAPMIVLPSIRLLEMERVLDARDSTVTFLLTGEVFVYRGRNYILPSQFTTLAIERAKAEEEVETTTTKHVEGGDDVADLIESLRSEAEDREDARADGGRSQGVARDGSLIVSKRGRVRRSTLGGWEFLVDNDADDASRGSRRADDDAPVTLLPCLLLELIEQEVGDSDRGGEFIMSGTVHAYAGESYLLPSMYRIVRPAEGGLTSGR